jgi:CubicO group peptidase (beta-lactamase class C family)
MLQTPFQLAWLGKPMTGVALMRLVRAGKLDFDAPTQPYLSIFGVADEAATAGPARPPLAMQTHMTHNDWRRSRDERRVRAGGSGAMNDHGRVQPRTRRLSLAQVAR